MASPARSTASCAHPRRARRGAHDDRHRRAGRAHRAALRDDRRGRRPAHAHGPAPDLRAQPADPRRLPHRAPGTSGGRSIAPTASCSRRWPASATGSCACRPTATARGSWSRRWSRASRSTTATSGRCASCCAIHPEERAGGRRDAALRARPRRHALGRRGRSPQRGADLIDLNMGCPVPKVCKTGAGAALLEDPDTAVAVARAAREGSGLPVTVKLRSGGGPATTTASSSRAAWSRRPASPAIAFHPRQRRPAPQGHARLRARARARRRAAGTGDPLGRPAATRRRPARRTTRRAPPP